MVPAAPLGNVMEQNSDIKHPARNDLAHRCRRMGMLPVKVAFFDPGEEANRADAMLIDRIMMIHVELHLGHNPSEVGHKTSKDRRLIHPAQHGFGIALAGQDAHEQSVRARVAAHLGIDQLAVAVGSAHRLRVNLKTMFVGKREYLDKPDGVRGKIIIGRQSEPPPVQHEPGQLARRAAKSC